jgi:hypothetical protein
MIEKAHFQHNGVRYEVKVVLAPKRRRYSPGPRKPKAFVWPDSNVIEDFKKRVTGERYALERVALNRELLLLGLAKLGIVAKHARYSRTCGCSCGCSPGFTIEADSTSLSFSDVHVTVPKKRKAAA